MTFTEQITSTFIGSILGFGFAIGLFYVTQTIKTNRKTKNLIDNLLNEVTYNITILDKWIEDIELRRRWLSRSEKTFNPIRKHSEIIQIHFLNRSIEEGILYDRDQWGRP